MPHAAVDLTRNNSLCMRNNGLENRDADERNLISFTANIHGILLKYLHHLL